MTMASSFEDASPVEILGCIRDVTGLNIIMDAQVSGKAQDPLPRFILSGAVETHLECICQQMNLGYYFDLDTHVVLITSQEKALEARGNQERAMKEAETISGRLERSSSSSGWISMPELTEILRDAIGVPVITSRELWEGNASAYLSPDRTLRTSLDKLASEADLRWLIREGKLYIVSVK